MSSENSKQYQNTKQSTFKTLLIKQLAIAISISLIITIPLVTIPAYLFIKGAIGSDIERIESLSHEAINTHLTTGWQAQNHDLVSRDINKLIADSTVSFQKVTDQTQINRTASTNQKRLQRLTKKAENEEQVASESSLVANRVYVAVPIKFQTACIDCRNIPLGSGSNYTGGLAGTMLVQAPMTIKNLSTSATVSFFLIFLVLFTLVAATVTHRLVQNMLLNPIEMISERIKRLKFSSHERHLDWQRTPQPLIEIDHIDESITEHIGIINQVYDKLDALVVTEHETGLFHRDRFNEVIRYEMFRSHRYVHPFSLLLIKLEKVRVLNSTAKNIEHESPGSKYMVFGNIIHNDTRETDLVFRLEEQIFAVVAPETDNIGIEKVKNDVYRRLTTKQQQEDQTRTTARPEYEFTIKMGVSTYYCDDDTSAKEILTSAIKAMQQAEPNTGRYPPAKPAAQIPTQETAQAAE